MKSTILRYNSSDQLYVEYGDDHLIMCTKLLNETFTGVVNLSNDITQYKPYTVNSNLVLTVGNNPIVLCSAFLRMIADGSHTPVFTAFKKSTSSQDWDTTLGIVHIVTFGYDGVDAWYSIDKEAV